MDQIWEIFQTALSKKSTILVGEVFPKNSLSGHFKATEFDIISF